MKARFFVDVHFAGRATDPNSIATALDHVKSCGMVQLAGTWKDLGGEPKVGEFFVLDTQQATEHAQVLDQLIDGQEDELGKSLLPVRDFLRKIARIG